MICLMFFFSSRRRHTRSYGDWSSDVCSSDLLPVMPASTQKLVLERAEGNPLYAAEYARMLADQPGEDLPLPETVQGVIAARIDEIGRASCRERAERSVGAVAVAGKSGEGCA